MEFYQKKIFFPQNNLNANSMTCNYYCDPLLNLAGVCFGYCFKECPKVCKFLLVDGIPLLPQRRPPPPPPPPPHLYRTVHIDDKVNPKQPVSTGLTIMACISGVALLFCLFSIILRAYKTRQRNARTRSAPIFFGTQEDFLNEDQGPEIDHPIWYINTIGLQQSVIDSIAVFRYKKDEGLTDGTDCSVCLTEFEEDESLRLLPKCSHAFHVPCIDTWLRSHKNCPLCRAPIVSDSFDVHAGSPVPATSDLSSREVPHMDNSDNNQSGEDVASERQSGDQINEFPIEDEANSANSDPKMSFGQCNLRNHLRVQSDSVDIGPPLETEMQPVRRSISLDDSSALANFIAVASIVPGEYQGSSDYQSGNIKQAKLKNVAKRGSSGSSSFRKMMKSSSISMGHSLQMGPILLKRSFSSSAKPSSSRHRRNQDPILPI